uniref:LITAF domain-containing protein n=1 Tax=Cyprinus carpio TaxID=7962 RepID=A0A8C2KWY1_CYPCA
MYYSAMTPVLPQVSEPGKDTTDQCNIIFRRQQLQNRLQFLQEIQKKNNRIEGYLANEEGPTELDRIEEELKLLEQKEKDLIQKKEQCLTTQTTDKETTAQLEKTETISPTIAQQEDHTEPVVSLDDVTMSPARVKCPSCQKIVSTEIFYKLGSNAFLFCCLLSVVGCLAGCCLIPFCMNRFKDVTHRCPSCHKDICSVNRI